MVDQLSPVPLYVQVADAVAALIKSGKLKPGQPVPSEKTLQQDHEVARGTVRQAMRLLRDRGLVITVPQRGTFVAPKI